jgi:L-ascorbate metabolism protein UlaG (beta-lactamase superfamily)
MKIYFAFLLVVFLLAGCSQFGVADTAALSAANRSTPTPDDPEATITILPSPTYYFPVDTPQIFINPTPDAALADVQVRMVGNSGFLVTIGEYKILIDGLFHGFNGGCALPAAIYNVVVNGAPPFDDIDLILATHDHSDHFDPEPVRLYMQDHPAVVFASTAQVASQLSEFGDRVISLDATDGNPVQADFNGIHVQAFFLTHGVAPAGENTIMNNGYVVTVNGISFFHTGDIDLQIIPETVFQSYGFPEMGLDFAFIPHFFLESAVYQPLITGVINSRYIISSHYLCSTSDPDQRLIERNFPGTVFFTHALETWGSP